MGNVYCTVVPWDNVMEKDNRKWISQKPPNRASLIEDRKCGEEPVHKSSCFFNLVPCLMFAEEAPADTKRVN